MPTLQFYTRQECSLCQSALAVLQRIQRRLPFALEIVDIDTDATLSARYGHVIPVVTFENQELARSFFDEKLLVSAIQKLRLTASSEGFSRSLDNYKP